MNWREALPTNRRYGGPIALDPIEAPGHIHANSFARCSRPTAGRRQAAAGITMLQRRIAATDRQIDCLVYELYGLTEEEIRIVEGGVE